METKTCKDCNETLPVSSFQLITSKKGKRQWFSSYCKECVRDRQYKQKYGVDFKEKSKMIEDQDNKCGICSKKFNNARDTHLDHCHSSGKVRKVLCGSCNMGLGYFKDDPSLLKKAFEYLEEAKLA